MSATKRELNLQSDRIEMVLATHKSPARVTGGTVTPRAVQFHLAPAAGTRINKVQSLADELALALGVSSVRWSRQGNQLHLEIPRDDPRPVRLLSLMSGLDKPLPAGVAVLGLCDDGAPLLIRLPSPDVAHILISGTTGSGKTALCQTMILSLAMTHRRSQLQFVLIDPKQRAFAPFATLPHLLQPVVGDPAKAASALEAVVRIMESRGSECPAPRIVVVMDELADLMQTSGASFAHSLTRLAQRGREAGIHIVACTQKPSSQVLGPLVRANFPARLAGRVVSAEDARVATGIGGTGAERLAGHGDFIAVAAGQVLRFHAAYVSPGEMKQVVNRLTSVRNVGAWNVTPPSRPSILEQVSAILP